MQRSRANSLPWSKAGLQAVRIDAGAPRTLASQSPQAFIDEVLVAGLGAKYVLVGDDFRFGTQRAGDYAMLDAAGQRQGFGLWPA
ncbi:Protein-tyrosine sulfotransferase 2 [Manis javanica]|nr:Protein-tyrosine sulfotransferase 2 [Manis javanica]